MAKGHEKISSPIRVCRAILWAGWALQMLGCQARPHAPALGDEPVYQNTREGIRFLAPEEWTLRAKAEIPPGKADKERLLVAYARRGADKGATLEVTLADLAPATDLAVYQGSHSFGAEKWRSAAPAETLQINGIPAVRLAFAVRSGKEELTREVVAIRRSERVYFFTGIFPTGDSKARDQVRRAIASAQWKN
jgi:hypothetical protein